MFEAMTFENIINEMLNITDQTIDRREGSVIYDALSPIAMEIAQMYADLDILLSECFADSASYYYLIKRAAERGIFVKEGVPSVIKVKCTPSDINVEIGTEFSIGDMNYSITDNLGEGYYSMTCEESGIDGNNITDDIIPVEYVEGLKGINAVEIMVYGTDDEDEESLRERYFNSFSEVAFGGNKADYKNKATSFASVGACKVYPVWNGGGTVKLVILDNQYNALSPSIISDIQNEFDPTGDGSGVGIAPIGHIVTVSTPSGYPVNVDCDIQYQTGYGWSDIVDTFTSEVKNYFKSVIEEEWEDKDSVTIRSGQIESILLNIPGVDNVTAVRLSGKTSNCIVPTTSIPVVGDVNG